MTFVTMFPETQNVHLIKDVGMIPYIMHKEYGLDSKIVCYNNGEYPYIKNEVYGLKIDFIKKCTGKSVIDGALYLLKNSKKIDILHLFHFSKRSAFWILIYKILNRHGKIYLKLDADYHIKSSMNPRKSNLKGYFKRKTLDRCNLISVENTNIYNFLKESWKIDVKLIPNGFYNNSERRNIYYKDKENIILTVGRIGTYQKSTEVLLDGFKLAYNDIKGWKLRIIGPVEDEFKSYLKKFFNENPELKDNIEIVGEISDRKILEDQYRKAKIFCLVSRYESFGLVFLEAMKLGCYIITSNVESAIDITCNKQYGDIFEIDDSNELSQLLIKNCNNERKILESSINIQNFVYKNFTWEKICKKILDYLEI